MRTTAPEDEASDDEFHMESCSPVANRREPLREFSGRENWCGFSQWERK